MCDSMFIQHITIVKLHLNNPHCLSLPGIKSLGVLELFRRGLQVILAQDGCSRHRVSSALYNGFLGQRTSYAAICCLGTISRSENGRDNLNVIL